MARELADLKCVPCQGGVPPLKGEEIKKHFAFPDFKAALEFVDKIGGLAEEIGHHPEINFGWGFAEVQIYTHHAEGGR